MTYQVTYRADAWVAAANGAPEWRQVVIVDLDDGAQLVGVVVRGASNGTPRVAEARTRRPTSPERQAGSGGRSSGCDRRRWS